MEAEEAKKEAKQDEVAVKSEKEVAAALEADDAKPPAVEKPPTVEKPGQDKNTAPATAEQLVKGIKVFAKRGKLFKNATVQGPSKKKEGHWALKFKEDGKRSREPRGLFGDIVVGE